MLVGQIFASIRPISTPTKQMSSVADINIVQLDAFNSYREETVSERLLSDHRPSIRRAFPFSPIKNAIWTACLVALRVGFIITTVAQLYTIVPRGCFSIAERLFTLFGVATLVNFLAFLAAKFTRTTVAVKITNFSGKAMQSTGTIATLLGLIEMLWSDPQVHQEIHIFLIIAGYCASVVLFGLYHPALLVHRFPKERVYKS